MTDFSLGSDIGNGRQTTVHRRVPIQVLRQELMLQGKQAENGLYASRCTCGMARKRLCGGYGGTASPNMRRRARVSLSSLLGVPVPWALI